MIFALTLTGAANGTTDALIPISSFTVRIRPSAEQSYLSCVVPNAGKNGSLIVARVNGNLQLDGDWQLIDCALTDLRVQVGPNQSSITLTGYGSVSNPSPQSVTISRVNYHQEDAGGAVRIRVPLQPILPGDTVVYNSVSYTVDTVAISSNVSQTQMELTLV